MCPSCGGKLKYVLDKKGVLVVKCQTCKNFKV